MHLNWLYVTTSEETRHLPGSRKRKPQWQSEAADRPSEHSALASWRGEYVTRYLHEGSDRLVPRYVSCPCSASASPDLPDCSTYPGGLQHPKKSRALDLCQTESCPFVSYPSIVSRRRSHSERPVSLRHLSKEMSGAAQDELVSHRLFSTSMLKAGLQKKHGWHPGWSFG